MPPEVTEPVSAGTESGLARLLELLDVEELDVDLYRGQTDANEPNGRLFGGLIAAQALRAAQRTVAPDQPVHSLHGYFLRAGLEGVPVVLHVDRIRDGRTFATRRVNAVQHGEAIFTLVASFQRPERGAEYADPGRPDVPDPDVAVHLPTPLDPFIRLRPIDLIELVPWNAAPESGDSERPVWIRMSGKLPDDPALHTCLLTYLSDISTVFTAVKAVATAPDADEFTPGRSKRLPMVASLDHSLWFHHPLRADEWMLMVQRAVAVGGARGLVAGGIYSRDGILGASLAQEALIRGRRRD
jgi:acyl-CoA thioesterase-2